MDLTKLSDKELVELKKQIIAEQEDRKDNLSYKNNIAFKDEQIKELDSYLNTILKEKGCTDIDISTMLHSPVWKICDSMFVICDYIYGNFEWKERNKPNKDELGITSIYLRTRLISRNTSRLLIDDKEGYKAMYDDIYAVIKKHMAKRKEAK